jgi:hypothetical protein
MTQLNACPSKLRSVRVNLDSGSSSKHFVHVFVPRASVSFAAARRFSFDS